MHWYLYKDESLLSMNAMLIRHSQRITYLVVHPDPSQSSGGGEEERWMDGGELQGSRSPEAFEDLHTASIHRGIEHFRWMDAESSQDTFT
ncbi:hypothetical protein HK097_007906 [Rhizophlyctis rosea]|uniref:Uncharacterized protein n=1 Tax=Rhizophlyctis rosea TaxID=64517 RepID=A0AAD5SB12_9FUNG|nr:hypothetical protein HK097_007906 [Rhizophlyctis rosea]